MLRSQTQGLQLCRLLPWQLVETQITVVTMAIEIDKTGRKPVAQHKWQWGHVDERRSRQLESREACAPLFHLSESRVFHAGREPLQPEPILKIDIQTGLSAFHVLTQRMPGSTNRLNA
jgi:hypothetical protein